jgi:hypothetical protein
MGEQPAAMTGRRGGLLRQRNFRLFWTGESISEVGNSVTVVVIPLVAIDTLHTSTFIVTLLTAMVWLPWVIIGIPAGAWVDRLPPRPVMLVSDAISVAVYASVPIAAWCGVLTVAQLIAVVLIAGAATVFFNSAYQVLLPGVVDEADLTEGNAKLLGSREVAQIGGPGLGDTEARTWSSWVSHRRWRHQLGHSHCCCQLGKSTDEDARRAADLGLGTCHCGVRAWTHLICPSRVYWSASTSHRGSWTTRLSSTRKSSASNATCTSASHPIQTQASG